MFSCNRSQTSGLSTTASAEDKTTSMSSTRSTKHAVSFFGDSSAIRLRVRGESTGETEDNHKSGDTNRGTPFQFRSKVVRLSGVRGASSYHRFGRTAERILVRMRPALGPYHEGKRNSRAVDRRGAGLPLATPSPRGTVILLSCSPVCLSLLC